MIKRICNEFGYRLNLNIIPEEIYIDSFENLRNIRITLFDNKSKVSFYYYCNINNVNGYHIEMICSGDYPFRSPKNIYVNYNSYNNKINFDNETKKFVEKRYDVICTCCESISCGNNWHPMFKIKYIIDEKYFWDNLLVRRMNLNIIRKNKNNIPSDLWNIIEDYIFYNKDDYQTMKRTGKYII
uniref:Uncharacterized protein n=1 Tax=viral metagenome TaxID=1070528 RepID=A0A6C0BSY8_9ZZZZ